MLECMFVLYAYKLEYAYMQASSLLFARAKKVGLVSRKFKLAPLLIDYIQELVRFLALYRIKSHAPLLVTGPRQFL